MNLESSIAAAAAFLLALLWTAAAMPAAVGLGRRTGMVSVPRLFGSHRRQVISLLGGLTLAAAAMLAFLLAGGLTRHAGAVLMGGAVLLLLGVLDDRMERGIAPRYRLGVETAVAIVAWWAGLRIDAFGVDWMDALVTVFFLVAAANAFNLLDNMDGVAGATGAATAAGLLLLAAMLGQHLVATMAAAVCGACLGFLRHNLIRARVYLGNGGSLFLGFLLGAGAVQLELPFEAPWGLIALVAAFLVPAADTSLVIVSRFISGRRIFLGSTDHISHRLVRLGLPGRMAAAAHALGAVAGCAAVAVAVDVGNPRMLRWVIAGGAAAVVALLAVRVYAPGPGSRPRRAVRVAAGLGAAAVVPAMIAALPLRADLQAGRQHLLAAHDAARRLDMEVADAALDRAERAFRRADGRLGAGWARGAAALPGIRGNLGVASALATSGLDLVAAGRAGLDVLGTLPTRDGRLGAPWRDGAFDLDPLLSAREPARRVQALVRRAEARVAGSGGVLLLPHVRAAREEAATALAEARRQADIAAWSLDLVPHLLGDGGRRTWLVAAENNAELRGRGGFVGAFGVVEAERGRLTLGRFVATRDLPPLSITPQRVGIPQEYRDHYRRLGGLAAWANLTMSPHFPSGARVLLAALEESGGPRAQGIVSMDPVGLSYMLEVTGPLTVRGIPEPVTAGNVVEWTLSRSYTLPNEERARVQAGIVEAVWERIASGDVDPAGLLRAVARGLGERRMVVYSTDAAEQAQIERLGMAGEVAGRRGDYLLVLAQNMGENKMDYHLARTVAYRGRVAADGSIESRLDVTIRNTAPPDPLPDEVGGPRPKLKLAAGEARSYLSALVPEEAVLQEVRIDGRRTRDFAVRAELGKKLFSTYVEAAPGVSRTVSFRYYVPRVLDRGRYGLTIQNQATARPDDVSVRVRLPSGAAVRLPRGFDRLARDETLAWEAPLVHEQHLEARVDVPLPARLAARAWRALHGPTAILFGP